MKIWESLRSTNVTFQQPKTESFTRQKKIAKTSLHCLNESFCLFNLFLIWANLKRVKSIKKKKMIKLVHKTEAPSAFNFWKLSQNVFPADAVVLRIWLLKCTQDLGWVCTLDLSVLWVFDIWHLRWLCRCKSINKDPWFLLGLLLLRQLSWRGRHSNATKAICNHNSISEEESPYLLQILQ